MKKLAVKFLAVAALFVSTTGVGFAAQYFDMRHYDHATLGQRFDPNAMVTECTGSHYVQNEKTTIYSYQYADGTICRVGVSQYGNVLMIRVIKP